MLNKAQNFGNRSQSQAISNTDDANTATNQESQSGDTYDGQDDVCPTQVKSPRDRSQENISPDNYNSGKHNPYENTQQ